VRVVFDRICKEACLGVDVTALPASDGDGSRVSNTPAANIFTHLRHLRLTMDKMKGFAKGGWHPAGDKPIHRDSWKSDLKGMATGKKKDPYEEQRNHSSAPLSSLKDPDSFGPPPKHTGYYAPNGQAISRTGTASSAGSAAAQGAALGGPTGGWGGSAVETGYAAKKKQEEEEQRRLEAEHAAQTKESGPWRVDGTGLRTDNLPKPPVRRGTPDTGSPTVPARQQIGNPAAPIRTASPQLPPRQLPRQAIGPPPVLPPRQNEYPDEHTPAPPPPYQEALQQRNPAQINTGAASRLGQAGITVPGFDISASHNTTQSPVQGPPQGQLSELQQRFARMNAGASESSTLPTISNAEGMAQAASQKKPPPPPPKKVGLSAASTSNVPAPPPLPLSSKPKPL